MQSRNNVLLALGLASALSFALVGCPGPGATPDQQSQGNSEAVKAFDHKKTVSVPVGPHGMAFAGGRIVNASPNGFKIAVIDPDQESVVKELDFSGETPQGKPSYTKASHDAAYAFNLDGGAKALRVIKGATGEQVKKIALDGATPGSKCVWEDDTTLIVPLKDAASKQNIARIKWTGGFEADPTVDRLTVNSDTATDSVGGFAAVGAGFIAAPNAADNSVSFIKIGNPEVTTIKQGLGPSAIDISTYGGKATLLFGNKISNTVVLYDLNEKKVVTELSVGKEPTDMALRADGRYAYVTCKGSEEVAIIDLGEKKATMVKVGRKLLDAASTANAGPVHIYAVTAPAAASQYRTAHEGHDHDADKQQIWVGGDGDGSVTVLDAETQKVIGVVRVGNGHHKMAFTATKAFVSNITDNTVSIIDRALVK
ncbi:YncE family protein [bacterium]|nr:YncE family protein [bacterium]